MTRFSERSTRRLLLAGVSAIALTTMSSQIQAADIAPRMVTKAPPPVVQDRCNWWIEGGGFDTAGSYNPFGARPGWGGEGAIGFDCRPAAYTPYVLQGQFRYGEAKRSSVFSQPQTFINTDFTDRPAIGVTSGTADNREIHWLVDLAVGRDFKLGTGTFTGKIGIRVAELLSKASMKGFFNGALDGNATSVTGPVAFGIRSRFLGVGPRIAGECDIPLAGGLSFECMVGVAALFGRRSLDVTGTTNLLYGGGPEVFLGGTTSLSSSDNAVILNADAQAGFSYWFSRTLKLSVTYRIDAYFDALKTVTLNGTVINNGVISGAVSNEDRIFHGPMIRLTARLP